jgi:4-aminobutyrate aminotransferase
MSAIVGLAEVLDAGSGALFTTVGNGTCCAAGLATICALEQDGLVEQAAINGRYLHERLACALEKYDIVGDVRGLGLIQGVELVRDRNGKEPNQQAAAKIVYRAWELGLILFYAGNWGNVLEITPPLVLTQAQIDEGVAILDQSIADVLAGKVSDEVIAPYAGW